MGFIQEFKEFAMRGNVVDLAVGLIIGAEFGKIVTSAVNDLIMPPIGKLIGGIDISELKMDLGESGAYKLAVKKKEEAESALAAVTEADPDYAKLKGTFDAAEAAVVAAPENLTLNYGSFLMTVFNFVIIAFAIFLVIKAMNSVKKKEEAAPAAPPKDVVLLEEIRDLLAKKG